MTTILLTALPGATSKILLSYPQINQGICTTSLKRNHKVFGPKQFDSPTFSYSVVQYMITTGINGYGDDDDDIDV